LGWSGIKCRRNGEGLLKCSCWRDSGRGKKWGIRKLGVVYGWIGLE